MAKFTVTFKDPDYSVQNGVTGRDVQLKAKFIEWDEYITIEFDPATQTARVVPVAETRS
jgi:hypothetical protein